MANRDALETSVNLCFSDDKANYYFCDEGGIALNTQDEDEYAFGYGPTFKINTELPFYLQIDLPKDQQ